MESEQKIKIRKRGNRLGVWFFKMAMRLTGLRGAYGLLYFVCAYYVWFDRAAVRSALPYIDRMFPGLNREQRLRMAYRLFVSQGKNLVDRHALVAGAFDFQININGYEQIAALPPEQGFILLTSHTGNWQTVMDALKKMNRRVHLLMRPEDNPAVREAVQVDAEDSMIKVISPDQHLGGVVEMMAALERGDIVSIMGDRTYGADSVEVNFLGDPAHFPFSAFQIAASAKCPIAVMLSSKTGATTYSVDIPKLFWPTLERRGDRKAQLREWVQKYATILETYLNQHPLQYFIFYDVWEKR